jgi:hypothetical protein
LHLSGRFSNTSGRHSVSNQLHDIFSKQRYGKIAATVWTIWIPIKKRSSIRQVVHSKFRHPDISLHGLDARATYMEIACIRSTIQTTIPLVRTRETLIWKLRAAEVRLSKRCSYQERISANFGKPIAQLSVRMPYVYRPDNA